MANFSIDSLRGGMNNNDPKISLDQDQSILAHNVEYVDSMLGERRLGTTGISIAGSGLVGRDAVPFLYRHIPSTDISAAELWALGVTGSASSALCRKTTTWSTVVPVDAMTLTGVYPYQVQAQSFHEKLFLAFKSGVDRLHVFDGTTLRRTGMAEPPAPTGANTAVGGVFTGVRYYRTRLTEKSGTTILRRSEPSEILTFTPDGTHTGVIITRGAGVGEGETHWELEASTDDANYYVIAETVLATTTYTDTNTLYSSFDLAPDIGDYSLLPSARFVISDEDRLLWAGSFEDVALASQVGWSPVRNATGAGNDERYAVDTTYALDLDTGVGGPLTAFIHPVMGSIWAFKRSHIYKLVRTNDVNAAYQALPWSGVRGALYNSVVEGVDQMGRPCLYFLDPKVGPCRLGTGGVLLCGQDLYKGTWKTVNQDAMVVSSVIYYPEKQQVRWAIATEGSDTPNLAIVLHVNRTREGDDGVRKGWVTWDGTPGAALTQCVFSDNIDANVARNNTLVPFIGLIGQGLIQRCEVGDDDNGVAFVPHILTKPYALRSLMDDSEVKEGTILAKAAPGVSVTMTISGNFGKVAQDPTLVDLSPEGAEEDVIVDIDNLSLSEIRVVQFTFEDGDSAAKWELNQLALRAEKGQTK